MASADVSESGGDLACRVRSLIEERLDKALKAMDFQADISALIPGKMLRTRLAGRLASGGGLGAPSETLVYGCAAVEMVHTASLCHDDVIDAALIRRSAPTLWRQTSCSAAVLIGDMLLCEAIDLMACAEAGRHVRKFVAKVKETCAAEAEQELLLRGGSVSEGLCLQLARGKTGALFSFVARLCGSGQPELAAALEEAGYALGAAYQVADDLLDVVGCEEQAGKTLGTDAKRRKFTLTDLPGGQELSRRHAGQLLQSALQSLAPWPRTQEACAAFISKDLLAMLAREGLELELPAPAPASAVAAGKVGHVG
ncbi:MAG: polyprenyl synthetase family protein [Phycisphaerae bacterium]|jgi:geranylgeranyl pyrophosphate synthase